VFENRVLKRGSGGSLEKTALGGAS
jgi:hypothetical protein